MPTPLNVMLLAAGRSTRLGALGLALPKPLVPVCGYPAVRFGLHAAARAGARRVVLNVFHRGDLLQATLGPRLAAGGGELELSYSVETELLGTGGGIAKARSLFGPGPVLVMNAKVVADLDVAALWQAHAAGGAVATMLLRDDPEPRRWGAIASDETGRVVGILDARSPRAPQGAVREQMFTGIHVLAPALLDRLQPVVSDVIRDAYIPALLAGETIRSTTLGGYFAEHSTPERYLAGNLALLREPALLPDPPGPLVGIDGGARVDPAAVVTDPVRIEAGAEIAAGASIGPDVVVGAGTRVASGARVRRSVLWAGSEVGPGEIEDAIVIRGELGRAVLVQA
jgi:mannose-1-phosphate guanylyltransferase